MEEKPQKAINLELHKKFFEYEGTAQKLGEAQLFKHHTFVFEKVVIPPDGGIFVKYQGCLEMKKGFPFPKATWAMDLVKKYLMNFVMTFNNAGLIPAMLVFALTPWYFKKRIIKNAVKRFCNFGDYAMETIYLKPQYTTATTKQIRLLLSEFWTSLGFKRKDGEQLGRVFSTLIEYDDAYRYRIQDILSTTTEYKLIKRPIREVSKLLRVSTKRDQQVSHKFRWVGTILTVALLSPKIRKAFRAALGAVNFKDMQMAPCDIYHSMLREGYDYGGLTEQERIDKWIDIHKDTELPPQIEVEG